MNNLIPVIFLYQSIEHSVSLSYSLKNDLSMPLRIEFSGCVDFPIDNDDVVVAF